jgi:hypothetical protein
MLTLELMPPLLLIGDPKEKFQMLKTRDNVDHAGLSQPPDHWNQNLPFMVQVWEISLNNNWLIAHKTMETRDAMEV